MEEDETIFYFSTAEIQKSTHLKKIDSGVKCLFTLPNAKVNFRNPDIPFIVHV